MDVKRIHFVGIGGIGMSGIAEVLLNLGYSVSGSDLAASAITRRLAKAGARVFKGHAKRHVRGAEVVVTSTAVAKDNPEVQEARRRKIPVIRRAEMLAELARLKKTVAVSGSHGKTTTTSLIAMALGAAGADPTMIIGGQLKNIASNARMGVGDYMVAEADESDGSFLLLSPLVAVVTNIDDDHLDHYGSLGKLRESFLEHLQRIPFYGAAVVCLDDPGLRALLPKIERRIVSYGLRSGADWTAKQLKTAKGETRFNAYYKGKKACSIRLGVPGRHNVLNALAALAAGSFLGFPAKALAGGISEFSGVGRRLEWIASERGVSILDDYGHHPTEIEATLTAVREAYTFRRLVVVFQPHRYSRTKQLWRAFGKSFKGADSVFVMEVYAAGEKPLRGVSKHLILRGLKNAGKAASAYPGPIDFARQIRKGDLVLTLGAGDVWKVGEDLKRRLHEGTLSLV